MMEKYIRQIPLLRLFIPFIAGLLSAIYYHPFTPEFTFICLLALLALLAFTQYFPGLKRKIKLRSFSIMLPLLMCMLGYYVTVNKLPEFHEDYYGKFISGENTLLVKLLEKPSERAKSYKSSAVVQVVINDSGRKASSGKILLYLQKDSLAASLNYGDRLLVQARPQELSNPKNPGEFNYKKYMYFDQVYYQLYLPEGKWKYIDNDGNSYMNFILDLRHKFLSILNKHLGKGDELAVASALVLGYKDDLTDEIRQSYATSGAMHVLAVSGLHVGLIFIVFNFLLKFLEKFRHGKYFKAAIMILLLWMYAAITGLSPSVTRASTMFSFVMIGITAGRITSVFHSITTSAFLLLLINPFLIMQVGFQLSYSAVLGIVILQPAIYKLWKPKSWLLDKIWAITAVSFAAQTATFPLGLLYFSQFPVYFLLSNLLVIPAATLILYSGFFLLLMDSVLGTFLPVVVHYAGLIFKTIIQLLNYSISIINNLPYSLISEVYISIVVSIFIYLLIISFSYSLIRRKSRQFVYSLAFILLLLGWETTYKIINRNKSELIFHSIRGHTALTFTSAGKAVLISDSHLLDNEEKILFHMKRHMWSKKIKGTGLSRLEIGGEAEEWNLKLNPPLLQSGNKTVFIATENTGLFPGIEVDYLLLTGRKNFDLKTLSENLVFKNLVLDVTLQWHVRNKLMEQCAEMDIPCHDLAEGGALVVIL